MTAKLIFILSKLQALAVIRSRAVERKNTKFMRIETERLILRTFEESDYDDLYEYLSQLENDEFEGYPEITYENKKDFLRRE